MSNAAIDKTKMKDGVGSDCRSVKDYEENELITCVFHKAVHHRSNSGRSFGGMKGCGI
jgi:hypothetical protein